MRNTEGAMALRRGFTTGDWRPDAAREFHHVAFNNLRYRSHGVHRANFDQNEVQHRQLLDIKTGENRYRVGPAWCSPKARDKAAIVAMARGARLLGRETCITFAMPSSEQAETFADANSIFIDDTLLTAANPGNNRNQLGDRQ